MKVTIQPHSPKGDRLRQARMTAGFKYANGAAKALGMLPSTYTSHENGLRDYDDDLAERYAGYFGVNKEWLILGAGPRVGENAALLGLPVMGEVRAGAWLESDDGPEIMERLPILPDPRFAAYRQFALRVVGISMDRVAAPGSYVIVADWTNKGTEDLANRDIVVACRERAGTHEFTLKRAKVNNGGWELWPESSDPKHQDPLHIGTSDSDVAVTIFAKVVGIYERV